MLQTHRQNLLDQTIAIVPEPNEQIGLILLFTNSVLTSFYYLPIIAQTSICKMNALIHRWLSICTILGTFIGRLVEQELCTVN